MAAAGKIVDHFVHTHGDTFRYKCFQGVEFEGGELNEEASAFEYHFADVRTGKSLLEVDVLRTPEGSLVIGELEHALTAEELDRLLPADLADRIRQVFEQDCRSIYEIELSERDVSGTRRPFDNPRRHTLVLEYGCTLPSGLGVEFKMPLSAIYALR